MQRINSTVVAIKCALETHGISAETGKRTTKKTAKYLLGLFSLVDDPRIKGMTDYPLEYILLIAFLAVLGNADTWREMEDFGKTKAGWLGKFLDVKSYGIPSHDTFRRVFGLIDTAQLQDTIVSLLSENLEVIRRGLCIDDPDGGYRLVCIDGKEENGTGRRYHAGTGGRVRNTQTLHVYDATNMVCLASEAIDKKTNEIPTAQAILRTMDLDGTICTFDALHMQRETVRIIRGRNGHYVGGLKGNQQGLMEDAAGCFDDAAVARLRKSRRKKNPVHLILTEHSHGQKETREYFMAPTPQDDERDSKWAGLRSYVMCIKTTEPDNPALAAVSETRYYASDLDDLQAIREAIRSHWAVEQFHWQLDYSYREDDNSTMDAKAFENLSLIIKMCLHVTQLMKMTESNTSVRRLRKRFAWNFEESMEKLLFVFSDEAILNTLDNMKSKMATICL